MDFFLNFSSTSLFQPLAVSFVICAAFACFGIIVPIKQRWQAHWIHKHPILRFGGVSITIGIASQIAIEESLHSLVWIGVLLSCAPLFLMGLLEDIGLHTSPKLRLIAGLFTACLAIFLTSTWLYETRIPFFDDAMRFPVIAIPVTIILSLALTQSYNLIDGLNGLSSGVGLIAMSLVFFLAKQNHDPELTSFAMISIGTFLGFWLINLATGKLFLGDSGAYLIGHIVGFSCILLVARNPTITPWALLLGTAYPVIELIITVARRAGSRVALTKPDRHHFHHKVKQFLERKLDINHNHYAYLSTIIILTPCAAVAFVAFTYATWSITCAVTTALFLGVVLAAFVVLSSSE